MKLRQKRVKCKCDNCSKETEWEVVSGESESPILSKIIEEWIIGYDVTGNGAMSTGSESYDYCSIKCLHEGIDKYFNPSNELTMIIKNQEAIKETL